MFHFQFAQHYSHFIMATFHFANCIVILVGPVVIAWVTPDETAHEVGVGEGNWENLIY